MYNCKDSIEFLLEYLDGTLPEEEAKQLHEHLVGCSPCVDFLKTYKATPKLCKRAMAKSMPEEMAQELSKFLRSKLQSK